MDNNQSGTTLSAIFGIGGGLSHYFLKMDVNPFLLNLGQAIVTAFLCGIVGAAGKELYTKIRKKKKR